MVNCSLHKREDLCSSTQNPQKRRGRQHVSAISVLRDSREGTCQALISPRIAKIGNCRFKEIPSQIYTEES